MDANDSPDSRTTPESNGPERLDAPSDRTAENPTDATVLVVDDEPQLVGMYASMLDDAYAVRTATSGEAALERLSDAIDVVLLDRRMPDVTGDDVLERIRESPYRCRVGVVTSIAPDVDVLEMRFDAYLVKPVRRRDLRDLVAELVARNRYSETVNELFSITSRLVSLEAELAPDELAADDAYRRLRERQAALQRNSREEFEGVAARDEVGLVYRDVVSEAARSGDR